uniref:Uncharacterized protein n=1 Tax=Arundo donax TaxID=35708 RepID=A0A0A9ATB3_ARUDO
MSTFAATNARTKLMALSPANWSKKSRCTKAMDHFFT